MGLNETFDREGLLASMRTVRSILGLLAAGLATPVVERYGENGLDVLSEAYFRWGQWRGQRLRNSAAAMTEGISPYVVIQNWDSTDIVLGYADGVMVPLSQRGNVELTFAELPFADLFTGPVLNLYDPLYRRTTEGMATQLRPTMDLQWSAPGAGLVATGIGAETRLLFRDLRPGDHTAPDVANVLAELPSDSKSAVALMRRSAMANGAFYAFVADTVIRRFDASGEALIRRGLRQIGELRGTTIREQHLAQGKELTVENLMNDWDGPLISVWTFRDEGVLTKDRWEQDCTWCPYAAAWAELGERGRELGYLYDVEMHTAIYGAYNPDITVKWEQLKTRGDGSCNFRLKLDK